MVLSTALILYQLVIAYKMRWKDSYTGFRGLMALVMSVCLLTILFGMIDLQIVYDWTADVTQDPFWFRVLLCFCEFGIWYGIYMTTFMVSYTYFQASLQLR